MISDFKDVKGLTCHYKFYAEILFSIFQPEPKAKKGKFFAPLFSRSEFQFMHSQSE